MNRIGWFSLQSCILILILCEAALASEGTHIREHTGKQHQAIEVKKTFQQWVDSTHAHISRGILRMSSRIDGLFGDEYLGEHTEHSLIAILPSVKLAESDKPELQSPVQVRLALPHLEDRFQLFLDALLKEEEHQETEDMESKPGEETEEESAHLVVGFQYKILQKASQWVSLGGDVNIQASEHEPLSKVWLRKHIGTGQWNVRLTQYLLWFKDNEWGETSRVDVDRWLTEDTLFYTTSKATWSERTDGVELSQAFQFHHSITPNWSIALKVSGNGHTKPAIAADKYQTVFTLRHRLYKNWLFVEVEPEAKFLREDDFEMNSLITCYLEMRFGDVPRRE